MQGGPLEMGLLVKPRGPMGINPSSSSVDSFGPKDMVDLRRTKAWKPSVDAGMVADGQSPLREPSDHFAEAQRCGPSHSVSPLSEISMFWEKDGLRRLSEAESLHIERTKTDLALVEEASRYDIPCQSGCLISEPLSFPSPFFGRTPMGEYCDLSGLEKERDEGENPLQMLIGTEPPLSENVECWDLVEVNKSRIEANGKELGSDQIVPRVNKAGGELSWEKSDLAKFSNFLGFLTEGLEKDIMEFLVKIRKRRERVHSKTLLEKSKFERELKRLECSINYEGGKKQNGGEQVRRCQITEFK